jgi:hypothetical protein
MKMNEAARAVSTLVEEATFGARAARERRDEYHLAD